MVRQGIARRAGSRRFIFRIDGLGELVMQAQTGNRAAFRELFERVQPAVYAGSLALLRSQSEAEELAQEVLLRGMRKLPQLRDAARFAGWLRRITVRMALDRLRRRGPRQSVEAAGADPLDAMIQREQADELYKALEQLKPADRAALVAFYIRGRTLKQLSDEFEAPIGTIKRRLHMARNRLKKVLEG